MSLSDRAERALNAYIGMRLEEDESYDNLETREHLVHLLRDLCYLIDEHGFDPKYVWADAIKQWKEAS